MKWVRFVSNILVPFLYQYLSPDNVLCSHYYYNKRSIRLYEARQIEFCW